MTLGVLFVTACGPDGSVRPEDPTAAAAARRSAYDIWTATGTISGGQLGWGLASGDLNADGFSDLVGGGSQIGATYVFHGSPTGLEHEPGWAEGGRQDYRVLAPVAVGDIDGDGFDDLVVGAEAQPAQPQTGLVLVFQGGPTGLATEATWTVTGEEGGLSGDETAIGYRVAVAGDVDGDGDDEIVLGEPWWSPLGEDGEPLDHSGRVSLYAGSPDGPASVPTWQASLTDVGLEDQALALFGEAVASAGDVDGDGFDDLLIGAPQVLFSDEVGFTGESAAYLFHGSAGGLDRHPGWFATPDEFNTYFGGAVASAGDVNGDGFDDVIVGARQFFLDDLGADNRGGVSVYLGSAAGLSKSPAWQLAGRHEDSWFGDSVSAAGDVDGDGFGDVVVGAPYDTNRDLLVVGSATVYPGSATGPSNKPLVRLEGTESTDVFGKAVRAAGDVDGDGFGDVAVGAPLRDGGATAGGAVMVLHGAAPPVP